MSDPQTPAIDDRDPAFQEAYPGSLLVRERALAVKRRREAKLPPADQMAGVGLSGGGIRSATFALGLFQGMAKSRDGGRPRRGLLRYVDYLSTVSGGGYFGSFFGQLLNRDFVQTPEDVEDVLLEKKEGWVLGFLRENGRYLSPNGGGDSLLFGSAILRNWVSIHIVLGLFTLAFFLGLQLLRTGLRFAEIPAKADDLVWWSPLLWLPIVTFVLAAVPLGWAYWLVKAERRAIAEGYGSANDEESANASIAAVVLVFVASALFAVFTWGSWAFFVLWVSLALIAALTFGFLKLAAARVPDDRSLKAPQTRGAKVWLSIYRNHDLRNRLSLWLTGALTVTALLLAVAVVDSLGQTVYAVLTGDGKTLAAWLAGAFGSLGVLAGFGRSIAVFFSKGPQGGRPSLPLNLIAGVAALLIVLLLLVAVDAGSHAIAFGLQPPAGAPDGLLEKTEGEYEVDVQGTPASGIDLRVRSASSAYEAGTEPGKRNGMLALLGLASTLLLSILFGQTWPFVNRSSHLPTYAARLTRAYLGASNPRRRDGTNLTEPMEGDDSDLSRYWPPPSQNGAPIVHRSGVYPTSSW